MNNLSDQNLVQRALTGDVDSFAELCRRYYPSLLALAYSMLHDSHLSEDAAQESLAQACSRLSTLRKQKAFGNWLGSICRNIARDMLRERLRQRKLSQDYTKAEKEDSAFQDLALKNAIRQLSTVYREAIYLRYTQDLTYQQMAAVLGISEEAVNGRLRRAKHKLARILEQTKEME